VERSKQIALVTGGASGLGKAIARRLTADGFLVVISDVQSELGDSVAAECGFLFLPQDTCDEARWSEIAAEMERRFGHWDVLVNNAGVLGRRDLVSPENTPLAEWKKIFAVNAEGVFLGCRAAIPAMRRAGGGAIVNISSVAGLTATPHATAYGASKAVVRHLTKSVAQYCAQQGLGIRCNSVHPGDVLTPLWMKHAEESARTRGVSVEDVVDGARSCVPLGDLTQPDDIAAAVAFLVSPAARQITGEQIVVDGGYLSCDTYRRSLIGK
jgi:NAD(P)-dependent dehydrogenase (short-subunit alcohol dehydrogenase family)